MGEIPEQWEDSDDDEIIYQSPNVSINPNSPQDDDSDPLDGGITIGEKGSTPGQRGFSKYFPALRHLALWRKATASDEVARIDETGCLSFITFAWIFPYLWSAFRGFIRRDEHWSTSIYDSTSINTARLEHLWKQELARKDGKPPSLIRTTWLFCSTRIYTACFIFVFCLAFGFIGPTCLVRVLIDYTDPAFGQQTISYGLFLAFSLLIVEVFRVLSYGATWATSYRTALRVRAAVLGLLYQKLITLRSFGDHTTGEIVNVFGNDGQRLFDAVVYAPLVMMGGFVLIGGLIYLLVLIGPWSLLGVALFFVFDAFQAVLGITMVKYRKLAIAQTENRVGLISEILRTMKLLKLYAWEQPFMYNVSNIRNNEHRFLRTAGCAQSLAISAGPVVPVVATIVTLLGYICTGHDLTPGQAFSMSTVYFVMVFGIRMIPYGMRYSAEALVSLRNIQSYLLLETVSLELTAPSNKRMSIVCFDTVAAYDVVGEKTDEGTELEDMGGRKNPLSIFNVMIEQNDLIGICGPVGSGKSSLLQAILGQMNIKKGTVEVSGRLAYVSQDPWILSATVRENIIFGSKFDETRYYKVIHACCLSNEISSMPAGDQTKVGERGASLSGGQKSRLALARLLYSNNRDVYLIDNALAQLDRTVADQCFRYGIQELLSGKTVLLVTDQEQYLSQCNQVIFMKSGYCVDFAPHELLVRQQPEYTQYIHSPSDLKQNADEIEELLKHRDGDPPLSATGEPPGSPFSKREFHVARERGASQRSATQSGSFSRDSAHGSAVVVDSMFDIPTADGDIKNDSEEDLQLVGVAKSVYLNYLRAAGGFFISLMVVLAFMLNVCITIFCSAWLAYWLKIAEEPCIEMQRAWANSPQIVSTGTMTTTSASTIAITTSANSTGQNGTWNEMSTLTMDCSIRNTDITYYATIYGFSAIALFASSVIKALFFVKISLTASTTMHNQMFRSIMHAPMRFFEVTPIGRIINRFSKDVDEVDVKLPFSTEVFLHNAMLMIGYLLYVSWAYPWFLVALVPLGVLFVGIVGSFRAGIRR